MSSVFNPSRLILARKRRGLSQKKLAELIEVEPRSISAYEKRQFNPDPERLIKLSSVLQFPQSFFFGKDLETLTADQASFRSLSRMTSAQRDTALSMGSIALLLNDWIEKRFELPAADLPNLSQEREPETAAQVIRQIWGLGVHPIKNAVHLFESKGIRVFSLDLDAHEVDAFSMWRGGTPFVFLNTKKTAERSRFDAAHELGHLLLHKHGSAQGKDVEMEANAFASAFLMPRSNISVPPFATMDQLIKLKKFWNVSLLAFVYRLNALNLISEWHYRSLCMQIDRKREPDGGILETSQIFTKVFASLRQDKIAKHNIASDLGITVSEIQSLIFGLALTSVEGNVKGPSSRIHSSALQRIK